MKKVQMLELMSQYPDIPIFEFEGRCLDCQCPVTVTVVRVHDYSFAEYAETFEVYGGAVHGSPDNFKLKCELCFSDDQHFGGKCEVYSRVVGYLSSMKQWNKGRLAEFNSRKMMNMGKGE